MKEDELAHVVNVLKGTIETTVNGKITRLSEKLDTYIKEDMKWKEEKVTPVLEAYSTVKNLGFFINWASKIIVSIGIIIGAWFAINK